MKLPIIFVLALLLTGPASAPAGEDEVRRISVTKDDRPREEDEEVRRALELPVKVEAGETTLDDLLETLDRRSTVFHLLTDHAQKAVGNKSVRFSSESGPLATVLDRVCTAWGLEYSVRDGLVLLALRGRMPPGPETRIYHLSPLIEDYRKAFGEYVEDEGDEDLSSELLDLVQRATAPSTEETEYRFAELRGATLRVRATPGEHDATRRLLDGLLNRRAVDRAPFPEWRTGLARKLEKRLSCSLESAVPKTVAELLAKTVEAPIVLDPDLDGLDADRAYRLKDVRALDLAHFLAHITGGEPEFRDGGVRITGEPSLEVRLHDVRRVLQPIRRSLGYSAPDELVELIYAYTSPDSWDRDDEPVLVVWNDLVVVRQSQYMHGLVERLLASLLSPAGRAPVSRIHPLDGPDDRVKVSLDTPVSARFEWEEPDGVLDTFRKATNLNVVCGRFQGEYFDALRHDLVPESVPARQCLDLLGHLCEFRTAVRGGS